MAQQCSVEWLYDKLTVAILLQGKIEFNCQKILEQAKKMHKAEHEDTYNEGKLNGFDFEDYYNDTFNK
jgi:hypothetical protein